MFKADGCWLNETACETEALQPLVAPLVVIV
jgi:hypothetical protein